MSTDDSAPLSASVSSQTDAPASLAQTSVGASYRAFSMHVVWTLGARLLMVANNIGSGIIVARWLGAEGLGAFAVLNVIATNAISISGAGLTAANTYYIAQDRRRLAPATLNALVYTLVGGGVLVLCIAALARYEPALLRGIPLTLVIIVAVSIPFHLITVLGLNIFLVLGRVVRFTLLDAAGQSFVLINALLALVIFGAGLETLVSLNTAASFVVSAVIVWLVYRFTVKQKGGLPWHPDVRLFGRMVRYGIKYQVLMTASMLIFRVDLLIVNHYRGAAEAGVYSVATQGGLLLMLLPNVIGTLLFPRVASMRDESGEFTSLVTRHTAFIMALICLLAAPAAFVLPLLYGAAFTDAAVQLLILLPGVYLVGLEMVLVQHFVGTGLPKAIPSFWLVTLALNITLNLLIVPAFGARGAAVVSTVSYTLISTLVLLYFRWKTGNNLSTTLVLRGMELRRLFDLRHRSISSLWT